MARLGRRFLVSVTIGAVQARGQPGTDLDDTADKWDGENEDVQILLGPALHPGDPEDVLPADSQGSHAHDAGSTHGMA